MSTPIAIEKPYPLDRSCGGEVVPCLARRFVFSVRAIGPNLVARSGQRGEVDALHTAHAGASQKAVGTCR